MKFFLVFALIIYGCSSNNIKNQNEPKVHLEEIKKSHSFKNFLSQERINILKDSILNFGDGASYNELSSFFTLNGQKDNLLYYALLMTNKYKNPSASKDVYYILSTPKNGLQIDELDSETKKTAIFFLLKSYEMGNENALYDIKYLFGDTKIPRAVMYASRN